MSIKQPLTVVFAVALALTGASCSGESGTAVGVPETPGASDSGTTQLETLTQTTKEATGTVRFEVTGSGTAYSVDWDPGKDGGADRETSVSLPWSGEFPDPGDIEIYQLVIVGGENVGCRILINDEEVASEPAGGSSHCTYVP